MNAPVDNPKVRGVRRWLLRDAINEYGRLLQSYGQSISESAFQGNDSHVRVHLRCNQLTLKAAIEAFKELQALDAEDTSYEKEPRK